MSTAIAISVALRKSKRIVQSRNSILDRNRPVFEFPWLRDMKCHVAFARLSPATGGERFFFSDRHRYRMAKIKCHGCENLDRLGIPRDHATCALRQQQGYACNKDWIDSTRTFLIYLSRPWILHIISNPENRRCFDVIFNIADSKNVNKFFRFNIGVERFDFSNIYKSYICSLNFPIFFLHSCFFKKRDKIM